MSDFDYIIVGAGSAGCVLADRLSSDGRHRILVLEAGGSDERFWIKTPIGYGRTFADPTVNWKYQAGPSPGLGGRTMYWPRGRVVGGSSSINALVYCRGMPEDFDDWRGLGNVGWGWQDVLPYFERNERRVDAAGHAAGSGSLDVKDVTPLLHATRAQWHRGRYPDIPPAGSCVGRHRAPAANAPRIPSVWAAHRLSLYGLTPAWPSSQQPALQSDVETIPFRFLKKPTRKSNLNL